MHSQSAGRHAVIVIGAGTGGIAVAARLKRKRPDVDITIIDPATFHSYQPAWTLVGAGAYAAQDTRRPMQACLPKGVTFIEAAVASMEPDEQQVTLKDGTRLKYDFLVVAAGIQINWSAIAGLEQTLGENGVSSNYRHDLAAYTWELVRNFNGGTAIFTQPVGAVKCPGAPQKALYLSADQFRRQGSPAQKLQFRSGAATIFGVPFYAKALDKIMASYHAETYYENHLVEVRGKEKIAVFETIVNGQTTREEIAFDLLHVVPPQSAPDFIRQSKLADSQGWLEVDKHTLRHLRYTNVFGIGDCTSTPNSKTAAAIKSQAPVVVANLISALTGQDQQQFYDGYAGCPLTTSRGKVMLAEFTYGGTVTPSLPFDPRKPSRFCWWLKHSFLPWYYWHGLLKGRAMIELHKTREYPKNVPAVQP